MNNHIACTLPTRNPYWLALPVFLSLAALAQNNNPSPNNAAPPDPAWKSKQIAEWSEDDAKKVIADSPWVKTFTPTLGSASSQSSARPRMGMGGIGMGGMRVGMGGMGRGGYPGGGYPQGGGYPGGYPNNSSNDLPKVTLRWESAMPIRSAELKAHDNNAPVIDDKHYAIGVYGVPGRYLVGETKKLESDLKKVATLRRDGKSFFLDDMVWQGKREL